MLTSHRLVYLFWSKEQIPIYGLWEREDGDGGAPSYGGTANEISRTIVEGDGAMKQPLMIQQMFSKERSCVLQ